MQHIYVRNKLTFKSVKRSLEGNKKVEEYVWLFLLCN